MGVWAILVGCIIGEVIAMSLLTKSEGFTQPLYGILSLVIYGGVIWVLSYVLTQLPMGVVYAVWSGMGIALISSLVGQFFSNRSRRCRFCVLL